VRPGC